MAQSKNLNDELKIIPGDSIIERKTIASGTYGCVYKARHIDWGEVAVKTLLNTETLYERVERNLKQEAQKLSRMSHPHIIQVLGVIMQPRDYSIVLEYMRNGCLEQFLHKYDMGWALKVRFAYQIALGMNYLHTAQPPIIHRDLKSQNVLVDKHFGIKITDFGISEWKATSKQFSRNAGRPTVAGTVTHIPPETWNDINSKPDEKVDVYAYAILLWEIQTVQSPFGSVNTGVISNCVKDGQRPSLDAIPPDAPALLRETMKDCWRQEPRQRPSFRELKETLEMRFRQQYQRGAEAEEVQLLIKQQNMQQRGSLDSHVEEDIGLNPSAPVLQSIEQLSIVSQPVSDPHNDEAPINDLLLPDQDTKQIPQGSEKKPTQRHTGTVIGVTDFGPNKPETHIGQNNVIGESLKAPVERNTRTVSKETDYGVHKQPTQRNTSTVRNLTDYTNLGPMGPRNAVHTDASPAGGAMPPPRQETGTDASQKTKPRFPTGPDAFPGQHKMAKDGRGYWYYPAPDLAPIYIPIAPNAKGASPHFGNIPNMNTAGPGNGQARIIHKTGDGSSTTIYNLQNLDGCQIGNDNVMVINTSGKKRSVASAKKTQPRPASATTTPTITESNRKITDDDAQLVARELGKDWKMLGRYLSLSEGEIDTINHDYQTDGLQEKIFQLLRTWRTNNGSQATARKLARKLVEMNRRDVAVKLKL